MGAWGESKSVILDIYVCVCVWGFFVGIGVWTKGPSLAMQVLHHSNHAPNSFLLNYFSGMVSCFCIGLASDYDPLVYASCIAGITGVCHHAWLIFCFVLFILVGWGLNSGLPACKAVTLLLRHTASPFFSGYFVEWVSWTVFPGCLKLWFS
jgi:hypothetical protein